MKLHPPLANKARVIPVDEPSFDPFVGLMQHQKSVLFPPGALAYIESERQRKIREMEKEKEAVNDEQESN